MVPARTPRRRRFTIEAACGLPALGGHFTGAPYVGYTASDDTRETTLGWRLKPGDPGRLDFALDLEAVRRARAAPEHHFGIEPRLQW